MKVRVLDPKDLSPDEQVMWETAQDQKQVPSRFAINLLFKLQEARNELAQLESRLSEDKAVKS
jgi:hypothetical protein